MNRDSRMTYLEGQLVKGEYNSVVRASRDAAALALVHATPMVRADALALAARILSEHGLTNVKVTIAGKGGRFTWGPKRHMVPLLCSDGVTPLYHWSTGKPRKRLRAVRDAAGVIVREERISLPRQASIAGSGWGLRVGVVLHEVAHAIDYNSRKTTRHDAAFTAILDDLIMAYGGTK